jgi:hypothetical protein
VGQPYFTRFVVLKDGRIESGLLAAEDDRSVTLKGENNVLKVLLRKDIEELTVQPKSVMPEGLGTNMSPGDLRDLIRYLVASPFLSEVELAVARKDAIDTTSPRHTSGVKWSRPVVGPTGRIALPAAKGPTAVHVAAEVRAPESMRTRLQLGGGEQVEAWLNGRQIFAGRAGDAAQPDQTSLEVELKPGLNRLLFRVAASGKPGALYVRLLDPHRKLRYPEHSE